MQIVFLHGLGWCVRVCACTHVCLHAPLNPPVLLSIFCPCQCIKMTPFQIKWRIVTQLTMQVARRYNNYFLEAQLFLNGPFMGAVQCYIAIYNVVY